MPNGPGTGLPNPQQYDLSTPAWRTTSPLVAEARFGPLDAARRRFRPLPSGAFVVPVCVALLILYGRSHMVASKRDSTADVDALLAAARATLGEHAVVKLTALGPKAVRPQLLAALAAEGFEATKSVVRRPLVVQLEEAFDRGVFIALKALGSFTRGGTGAEARAAGARLIREGRALRVVRGSAEVLVPRDTVVLSREQLVSAQRRLVAMNKVLAKAVKSPGATVLRADLVDDIAGVLARVPDARVTETATPARGQGGEDTSSALLRVLLALDETRDDAVGLSFIPRLVVTLGKELAPDTVRAALLEGARRGLVELRPEGGLNRLTPDELARCLPGPQGTRLSWARRIAAGAS